MGILVDGYPGRVSHLPATPASFQDYSSNMAKVTCLIAKVVFRDECKLVEYLPSKYKKPSSVPVLL